MTDDAVRAIERGLASIPHDALAGVYRERRRRAALAALERAKREPDDGAFASAIERVETFHLRLLALAPVREGGRVRLRDQRDSERRRLGAWYTPPEAVETVLDLALDPLIERAHGSADPERALLDLRVLDPACGSGRFLTAAARRIGRALARERSGGGRPSSGESQRALADAARACVFGADVDDVAATICRAALARPAGSPLDDRVRCADFLVGATRALVRAGVPDDAYRVRAGDDAAAASALRRRNASEREKARRAVDRAAEVDWASACDAWGRAFFWREALARGQRAPTSADVARAALGEIDPTDRDGLHPELAWSEVVERGGFDLVVGNPPFLNQLRAGTASGHAVAAIVRARTGGAVHGYTDVSGAFLAIGADLLRPGGRLAMITPASLASAASAAPLRERLDEATTSVARWRPNRPVFDALVDVEADVRERLAHKAPRVVTRPRHGDQTLAAAGTLADIAEATADFRDQYYGLRDALIDAREADDDRFPPVVTCGLIDPARRLWGEREARLHKRLWRAPRADLATLDQDRAMARWARARLTPKVLLATQTRILECVVDERGVWLPSVPVITLTARAEEDLWRVAAVLAAPPVAEVARSRHAGTGLSRDSIRVSASRALDLPIPADDAMWSRAADAFRAASRADEGCEQREALFACARWMCAAYGLRERDSRGAVRRWSSRLPSERPGRPAQAPSPRGA